MRDSNFRSSPGTLREAPNPYDLVPYESYPFPRSHIRHLHAIGRLFALTPPAPDGCRVLELGGASGGNLIPVAIDHPGSHFLGIDLSARQIEAGQRQIADLGLKNIELRTGSIVDIDAGIGAFDYIIAHGVFSWVPPAVREKLLAVCRDCLAPQGIALVSHNTLPGWSPWQSLRETIRHHSRHITDPLETARAACSNPCTARAGSTARLIGKCFAARSIRCWSSPTGSCFTITSRRTTSPSTSISSSSRRAGRGSAIWARPISRPCTAARCRQRRSRPWAWPRT